MRAAAGRDWCDAVGRVDSGTVDQGPGRAAAWFEREQRAWRERWDGYLRGQVVLVECECVGGWLLKGWQALRAPVCAGACSLL